MHILPSIILVLQAIDLLTAVEYHAGGWQAASDFLLDSIDTKHDPCESFYDYACGKWQQNYGQYFKMQQMRTMRSMFDRLVKIVTNTSEDDRSLPRYKRSLKTIYAQCLKGFEQTSVNLTDVYAKLESALAPLPLIEKARGKAVVQKHDFYYLLGKVQRTLNIPLLIEARVRSVVQGCDRKPLLYLRQPLADSNNLFLPSGDIEDLSDLLSNLGRSLNLNVDTDQLTSFSERLEKLKDTKPESESPDEPPFSTVPLHNLSLAISGEIKWEEFLKGLLPKEFLAEWKDQNPMVGIEDIAYFRQLASDLSSLTYEEQMAYLYLKSIRLILSLWQRSYESLLNEMHHMTGPGAEGYCVWKLTKLASGAAVRVLFESLDSDVNKWKHDLEMMAETIFSAAKYLMHTSDWMDVKHKAAMVQRIESMRFLPGIPDWILDDEAIELHTPHYDSRLTLLQNDMRMMKKKFMWRMRLLQRKQVSLAGYRDFQLQTSLDPEPIFAANAMYWMKTLQLMFGYTVPPMYNYTYPLPLKYGLVGMVIGHELFHGFHRGHEVYDRYDDVKKLMSKEMLSRFENRVNCLRRQYSNVCYGKEGYCLSGTNTINDNIADVEGLKVAYMAFKFMSQTGGTGYGASKPAILANYTLDQLFFLSVAQVRCSEDGNVEMYKDDEHSPPRARIELSMMNFPAFAQAFHCKTGQRFAPMETCDLWGQFIEPHTTKRKK